MPGVAWWGVPGGGFRGLAARQPATTRPLIRKSPADAGRNGSCGLHGVEVDLVAEPVELADQAVGGAGLAGAFEEVVAAQVGVLKIAGEHVPDRDEDGVLQGDRARLRPRRATSRL